MGIFPSLRLLLRCSPLLPGPLCMCAHIAACCYPAQQQRMIEDLKAEGGEEAASRNVKALIRTLTFERIQAKNAEGGAGAQVRGG